MSVWCSGMPVITVATNLPSQIEAKSTSQQVLMSLTESLNEIIKVHRGIFSRLSTLQKLDDLAY